MSLYGTALLASMLIIIFMVSDMLYLTVSYSELLNTQELYGKIVDAETMRSMIASTAPPAQNTSGFSSWVAAMESASHADGFYLQRFNNTLLIKSTSGPEVYSTISLN